MKIYHIKITCVFSVQCVFAIVMGKDIMGGFWFNAVVDMLAGRDWVTVCISGVTCGGKSTLARALHKAFNDSIYIRQDDYFWGPDISYHPFIQSINHSNWETMASLDMERMRNDVNKTLQRYNVYRDK